MGVDFDGVFADLEKISSPKHLARWESSNLLEQVLLPLLEEASNLGPDERSVVEKRIERAFAAVDPGQKVPHFTLDYLKSRMPPPPGRVAKRLTFGEAIAKFEPILNAQEEIQKGWEESALYALAAAYVDVLDAPDNPNDKKFELLDDRFESLGRRINPDGKNDDLDPRQMINFIGLI